MNNKEFNLVYHSGATEGINTFIKGIALENFKNKKLSSFFFSTVDHACVVQLKEDLEILGHSVFLFEVDRNGQFDKNLLINKINDQKKLGHDCILNYTYINNESGIVWPLNIAEEIRLATGCIIHVDAVQLVGKISSWQDLSLKLDGYTFSGHKFGAMKSIGFSFIQKSTNLRALLVGGNQQNGMRAGTENALAIYSLKLALADMTENFSAAILDESKSYIESNLIELIKDRGEIVGYHSQVRNLNTIFLILYGQKAETLSAKFDLLGVDLSTGSACSSGIIKENRILMSMGQSFENSRSSLRFSFSPFMTIEESKIYFEKIQSILKTFLS